MERGIEISTDGSQLVYKTENGFYLRSMDQMDARLILGSEEKPQKPFFSPDGKTVMFTQGPATSGKIVVQSLETGERKDLIAGDSARYISTGHIVYALRDRNDLFAAPFDIDSLKLTGEPVSLVHGILRSRGAPQFAVSDSGTLVYIPGTSTVDAFPLSTFIWVDRKGQEESLEVLPDIYGNPRISPDGTQIAFTISVGGRPDIWIRDLARKASNKLTNDEA